MPHVTHARPWSRQRCVTAKAVIDPDQTASKTHLGADQIIEVPRFDPDQTAAGRPQHGPGTSILAVKKRHISPSDSAIQRALMTRTNRPGGLTAELGIVTSGQAAQSNPCPGKQCQTTAPNVRPVTITLRNAERHAHSPRSPYRWLPPGISRRHSPAAAAPAGL